MLMNEGLELLKFFGFDDETFGATLAIVARCQGNSVGSIITSLEASAAAGSLQARDALSFCHRANEALQAMADAARAQRLHAGPGGAGHGQP
jgi:hypothetical protein